MTSISALSTHHHASPLQRLQDELQVEVDSGAISSTDQSALSSALGDIDSALQSSRTSDQSSGTRLSPDEFASRIDDLIQQEVSSGKLTDQQATELQGVFKAAFSHGPGGPGGAGGPPPGPPPSGGSSAGGTDGSSSGNPLVDLLQQFLQSLTSSSTDSTSSSTTGSSDTTTGSSTDSSKSTTSATELLQQFLQSLKDSFTDHTYDAGSTDAATANASVSGVLLNDRV